MPPGLDNQVNAQQKMVGNEIALADETRLGWLLSAEQPRFLYGKIHRWYRCS